jgi:hypothetical protein
MKNEKKYPMLRNLVEEAIEVAREESERTKDRMGVNWANLRCVSIKRCVDEDGIESFHILIEEASPDANEFIQIVHRHVSDGILLLTSQVVNLEVETAW